MKIDITQIQKMVHDYEAASGERPEEILMPPHIKYLVDKYSAACNVPPHDTFMGIPIVVSPLCPPETVYVGKKFIQ